MEATIICLIDKMTVSLGDSAGLCEILKDDKRLREPFHEAGRSLWLLQKTLENFKNLLNKPNRDWNIPGMMDRLKNCDMNAKGCEEMLHAVSQAPERYQEIAKQKGPVEKLILGMINNVCVIIDTDATLKADMQHQNEELREAADKLSRMGSSVSGEVLDNSFTNYNGEQFNAVYSTQNVTKGTGNQFPGASINGGVHFG